VSETLTGQTFQVSNECLSANFPKYLEKEIQGNQSKWFEWSGIKTYFEGIVARLTSFFVGVIEIFAGIPVRTVKSSFYQVEHDFFNRNSAVFVIDIYGPCFSFMFLQCDL